VPAYSGRSETVRSEADARTFKIIGCDIRQRFSRRARRSSRYLGEPPDERSRSARTEHRHPVFSCDFEGTYFTRREVPRLAVPRSMEIAWKYGAVREKSVENVKFSEHQLSIVYSSAGMARHPRRGPLTYVEAELPDVQEDSRDIALSVDTFERQGIFVRTFEVPVREGNKNTFKLGTYYSFSHLGSAFVMACRDPILRCPDVAPFRVGCRLIRELRAPNPNQFSAFRLSPPLGSPPLAWETLPARITPFQLHQSRLYFSSALICGRGGLYKRTSMI
jgi:hypothetical protein